jgi:hypothetical protein
VKYPPTYPDVGPELAIWASPDASTHPWIDPKEEDVRLLGSLDQTIEENLGIAMVYSIVLALQEAVLNLVHERAQVKRDEHTAVLLKAEEEENRKFAGTVVTPGKFILSCIIQIQESANELPFTSC